MQHRIHKGQTQNHQFAQATEFAGSLVATASLVFHNSGQIEKTDGSSMGMNFDLKTPALFWRHVRTVKESQSGKAMAES